MTLPLSVVIPTKEAEHIVGDCVASVLANDPAEVIVVDGQSRDGTRDVLRAFVAAGFPVTVISDDGGGLPVARMRGAELATCEHVALVDADVVLPRGSLAALLDEFERDGCNALQAGLHSVGENGYWGEALAYHHRTGRSRHWFGLVATIMRREELLHHGFDQRFDSGEDVDLRVRLRRSGARIGVSRETTVIHRFHRGDFAFARSQWLADGAGIAHTIQAHGARQLPLLLLPLAAGVRGGLLCLVRGRVRWLPYFALFVPYNYLGMVRAWRDGRRLGTGHAVPAG